MILYINESCQCHQALCICNNQAVNLRLLEEDWSTWSQISVKFLDLKFDLFVWNNKWDRGLGEMD